MAHDRTLLPGDGIGLEVVDATLIAIDATGVPVEWERFEEVGARALDAGKAPFTSEVVASIDRNKIGLKGPITTPVGDGFTSVNVQFRHELDLYANVRPCVNLTRLDRPFDDLTGELGGLALTAEFADLTSGLQ